MQSSIVKLLRSRLQKAGSSNFAIDSTYNSARKISKWTNRTFLCLFSFDFNNNLVILTICFVEIISKLTIKRSKYKEILLSEVLLFWI